MAKPVMTVCSRCKRTTMGPCRRCARIDGHQVDDQAKSCADKTADWYDALNEGDCV